jgi:hypothetical protein
MHKYDNFVITVGEKEYKHKKLSQIPLVELDAYLGRLEDWDEKYKSPRVLNLIEVIKIYLTDPAIMAQLQSELA